MRKPTELAAALGATGIVAAADSPFTATTTAISAKAAQLLFTAGVDGITCRYRTGTGHTTRTSASVGEQAVEATSGRPA